MNQSATETQPAGARESEFRPVSGAEQTTSASALLIAAYCIMWALVFGVILMTWRKQAKLSARLGQLETNLQQRDQDA